MQTFQEFLLATKANEYLIAIAFLAAFILFLRFLNAPHPHTVRKYATEPDYSIRGMFAHPSHTWAEVLQPNLVAVGMDRFTTSVFGSIDKIELPRPGDRIYQGSQVWKIKRDRRELVQLCPLSGRVVEINEEFEKNPRLLNHGSTKKNWIMKIEPAHLVRETRNLLFGETIAQWNRGMKEQLVALLVPARIPVLQDGGEIKPDLGNELTALQWEKIAHQLFNMWVGK